MKIIRKDLVRGKQKVVAGYGDINLQTGLTFLHDFAQSEADERKDVASISHRSIKAGEQVEHCLTLMGKIGNTCLVEYRLHLP